MKTARRLVVGLIVAMTLSACIGQLLAAPPGSGWRLVHADEFSGESVDNVKWATRYQWGRTHNHDAYMRDDNVRVEDGSVQLDATRESFGGKPFTSGVISSHDTFRYTYGYAEMRIKMPSNRGSWPAFWMLSSGWPPEIDIMEYPLFTGNNKTDEYAVNSFWGSCCNPPSNFSWIDTNQNLGNDYHTFGLEWNSNNLKYYFDGQLVKTAANQSSFQNMYLIFNYAVGGWPGTPSQAQWANGESDVTHADWVRVWKNVGSVPDTAWTSTSGAWDWWGTDGNWSGGEPNVERQTALLNTLAGKTAMEIRWGDSKTVGNIYLDGDTAYTLGQAGGDVESLMFADRGDGWSRLWVRSGAGGHTVNSRLDAWSNLSIQNRGTASLTINGDILGQVRDNGDGTYSGGRLLLRDAGDIILNGIGSYQNSTELRDGVNVQLGGKIYQENTVISSATLEINDSTLRLGNLHGPTESATLGSLGYLPMKSDRILIDGGELIVGSGFSTERGLTIRSGGATISTVDPRFTAVFSDSRFNDQAIVNNEGGTLTLGGSGVGELNKSLGGAGGLIKTGVGSWRLGAPNGYSGPTEIEAGTLTVDGTTGWGSTSIAAGAVVNGDGTIRGNLQVAGQIQPGTAIGQISVLGDAEFETGSELQIQVLDPSTFDSLDVTGSTAIQPGSSLKLLLAGNSTGAFAAGDSMELLTSDGGLVGMFDSVDLPTIDGLHWILDYTTNSLVAELVYAADFNVDSQVSGADFLQWQQGFGRFGDAQHADGDADGDTNVDAADLAIWQQQYGADSATSPLAVIPEPSSVAMIVLTTAIVSATCRREAPEIRPTT